MMENRKEKDSFGVVLIILGGICGLWKLDNFWEVFELELESFSWSNEKKGLSRGREQDTSNYSKM